MLAAAMTRLGRVPAARGLFEYAFWVRRRLEGSLANAGYEFYFTDLLGLDRDFYAGKRLLDVGCGPRGSLEWATMANERVGADPLADAYRPLGTRNHAMTYVRADAEALPFPDGSFDVVSCINALDHVNSVEQAAAELVRVTAPEGMLLLLVDIDHAPTPTEPHQFSRSVLSLFAGCVVEDERVVAKEGAMLESLRKPHPGIDGEPGTLIARMTRTR